MKHLTKFLSIAIFALMICSSPCAASYQVVQDLTDVEIKSPMLKNLEKAKVRLDNGVEVFLVSDPQATKSGAALAVGIGKNDEPFDQIGLAHFVEHMLFLGTEKYPVEKEYSEFIESNGGTSNAYTSSDKTVYYFDINNDHFKEALDRFSCFFVSPLFNESGLEREQHAVNQEFLYRTNEDGYRIHILSRSFFDENSHAQANRCGNLETLQKISREDVIRWYQSNYSANLMKVCVYSSLPMEELLTQVDQCFSPVENKNVKRNLLNYPVTKEEHLGKMAYIEPLHDVKYLVIRWELPPEFNHDLDYHTADLLTDILAEESPKSVATFLKEKNYVHGLYGANFKEDQVVSDFRIYAELTEEGLANRDEVIAKIYEAIHTFQKTGIPRYRFDENTSLAKLSYQYQSRPNAFSFASACAAGLLDEDLETFPSKSSWPTKYSAERVEKLLTFLKAEQAMYFIVAPQEKVGKVYDLVEDTVGINYALESIPKKVLREWENKKPSLDIAIAPPNAYVPSNVEIVTTYKDYSEEPTLIKQGDKFNVYYLADQTYQMPEVSYKVMLQSPSFVENGQNEVLSDLYVYSLLDALSQHLEQGYAAGINASISTSTKYGLTISVTGYSQKAEMFLNKIISEANGHAPKAKDFAKYKDRLLREYQNQKKEIPGRLALEEMNNLIIQNYASYDLKAQMLQSTTYEQLVSYCQNLFENIYVRSFVYGNVSMKSAEEWTAFLENTFEYSKPYPEDEQYKRAILELSCGSTPRYYDQNVAQEGNAALLMVSHGYLDGKEKAAFDVMNKALSVPFYETLRTKQQVGYIVNSFPRDYEKKFFSCFLVQSNSCSTRDLLARYELFNEEFLASIGSEEFPESKFQSIKEALIEQYLMPSNSIAEKGAELSALAFNHQGNFNLKKERAEALKNLTFEEFAGFCCQELGKENARRIAVLVNGKMSDQPTLTYQPINDVTHFKAENDYRAEEANSSFYEKALDEKVE